MKPRMQVLSTAVVLLMATVTFSLMLQSPEPSSPPQTTADTYRGQTLVMPDLFLEEKRRAVHEELPAQF